MRHSKIFLLPLTFIALVLLGAGCARNGGISVGPSGQDAPKTVVGVREKEGCENSGLRYDSALGDFVKNRIITGSFPADLPHPSAQWGEWRVGSAQCGKYGQGGREADQYVVVWFGEKDPKFSKRGLIIEEYMKLIESAGWEIIKGLGNSKISFSAQKDGGARTLYVSVSGGFISEEDKNEVFPEATVNFHVDHKQWQ